MIGLDTNILVRYLTQDDPIQSPKATRILERTFTPERPGFLSLASILETAWVLENIYGLSNLKLAETMERLLQIEDLLIQNEKEVHAAMLTLRTGQGSFDDALIGALGTWAGCDFTLTFDKKASRLQGFELIR
jgi:predicted nucleic-acid-binding protein